MRYFDYIVAGSGLAGLYSAYRASKYGKVALVTKSSIRQSSSYYAQGGIAAVTAGDDSPLFHFQDTLTAGRGLCDSSAVNILVNEGPERIHELVEEGMQFDTFHGTYLLGLEGGHNKRRILHSGGDATGMKITEFMISKVLSRSQIEIFENCTVTSLLVQGDRCSGITLWNNGNNSNDTFIGRSTILALGGASAIYDRTSNPETSTGEGVALAYEAGCKIADMEFIQFHPTTLCTPSGKTFLISEAVRGEGAYLLNKNGERFMPGIHERAELAPRDIVAQSIYREMLKDKSDHVYLSLEHLDKDIIRDRFPNIYEKCSQEGFDLTKRIPVAPAAHYMVGGVKTDEYGRTNIGSLYAVGEVASTGIMGANRLASNSLVECLVFGYRAVEDASERCEDPIVKEDFADNPYLKDEANNQLLSFVKREVGSIMAECAGIIRNEHLLRQGEERLNKLMASLPAMPFEINRKRASNLVEVATLIIRSALERRESRGGHFREDYPHENEKYLYHIIQRLGADIETIPVDN